jgi:thiamine biosynthesis lipoprotein
VTQRVEQIMGLPIVVDVRDDVDDETVERVFDWFRWVDSTFSTYKDTSEISRLDRGELALPDAHHLVREVLDRCDELRNETDGYFDTGIAGRLDPSGYVKGWSVDCAAALLEDAGVRNYAINAGGDMRIAGGALPELEWRVGIEHPLEHDKLAAVIAASCGAIATSASYARGEHVLDPHSGRAPTGVLSVTITGPDLGTADAYATAAFAMGERGPAWTGRLPGYEALTILADRRVLSTQGFPRSVDGRRDAVDALDEPRVPAAHGAGMARDR